MEELIRECSVLPRLTEQETYELLVSHSEEGIHKVILHNVYKVIELIDKSYSSFQDKDEIFSCGLLGLTKAVNAYSVDGSFKLRNFDMLVRNYINREIRCLLDSDIPEDSVGDYHDVLQQADLLLLPNSNQIEHNYIRGEIIGVAVKKIKNVSKQKFDIIRMHSLGYDHVEIGKKYKITGQAVFNHLESIKRIGRILRGIGYSIDDTTFEENITYKRVLH